MAAYLIKDNILDHHEQQPEAIASFDFGNAKEFPLVTLCWNERHFLKIVAAHCGHHTQTNEPIFYQIMQSCLEANMTNEDILDVKGRAWVWNGDTLPRVMIEIRPFNGSYFFKTSTRGQWSMLIHPKLGPCYTFELDKSTPVRDIYIYPNHGKLKHFFTKFVH